MESHSILNGVVGYVEVRSSYDNRSAAIAKEMEQLGARVLTTFTDDVTHVVFKEGLKRTWNKAMKRGIPLVSVSWLDSCKQHQQRVPEKEFPALIPEDNSGSPLLRFNPAPRWKKFKSMQPCDFEEDLAKSAEKLEKRLKRKIKANRFNPQEEATPTMSSHLRILALDTQARTPTVPWDNASPSFIPETPQSMRVRLERMRQEHREVLSPDYESPPATPKQLLVQTRHPRHLLDKLVSCTSSENSNDNQEAMSRMVAGIIQNLDSSSSSQSPVCKTMPQKKIPSGLVTNLGMQSLNNLIGTNTEEHEMICDENFSLCIENVSIRKSYSSDSRTSAKPLSPQDLNTEKSPAGWEAPNGRAKPCHEESPLCLAAFGSEGNQNVSPSRDTPKVAGNLISEGNTQDFTSATCPKNGKKQPIFKPVYTKVDSNLAGWDSDTADHTADQLKAKPAKKRKLLTGNQFYSSQSPCTVIGLNSSPEAPSSSKGKGETPSSTDASFLFGIAESKTGPKLKSDRRRSERLQSTQVNKSYLKSRRRSVSQNLSSNGSLNEQCINISLDVTANTKVGECTQRNTLGTSMSVMYPNDTSTDRSTTSRSRLSMDDFSHNKKTLVAAKKRRKESPSATVKQGPRSMALSSVTTNSNGQLKPGESSAKGVKKKSLPKGSATIPQPSQKPVKRKRVPSSSSGGDTDTSLNRSSSAHKAEGTRACLRHARSLILEQPHKLINRKLPYSLVVTSLHREEQELTYSVVKKLGIFQLTNNVDSTTTHVVCGEPRRTLNVLQAIARGCWVLKKEWVLESLESGEWLEEDKYEMDADFPAAKKSRLERQKAGVLYKMDLFSKKGPIYVSDNCTPKRTDVVHLINLCCGHVTGSKVRAALHIGDKHDPEKIMIRPTWVLDCIMKMETLDVSSEQYIVPPPTASSQRECSPEF